MAALLQAVLPLIPQGKRSVGLYAAALYHQFSPEMLSSPAAASSFALVEPLSPQEGRVLKLLAAGLSNHEIASELVVSTNTIKTHIKNIYRKLNIRSREEARGMVKTLKLF